MESRWRVALSISGSIFLGAVLLFAGWAKALDPLAFAAQIKSEGLEFLLPASVIALVALALEFFLGAALLLALRHRAILWSSAALVAFFLFLTGRTFWRFLQGIEPPEESCGCFGRLIARTPAEAFWQDVALLVPALFLAFLAVDRRPGRAWRFRLALAGLLTVAATLFAWHSPDLPLDDFVTALKPGIVTKTLCVGDPTQGSGACLDDIVPELAERRHLVILAAVDDRVFGDAVTALNEFHWKEGMPTLWVLSDASPEALFQFRFERGPTFELREAPRPLIKSMSRRLPRSFLVEGGKVIETWSGLPPLDRWSDPRGNEIARAIP